ncbi:MAG: protein kinase [Kofleriaceae bacterium]
MSEMPEPALKAVKAAVPDFEPPAEFDDYMIVQELGRGQMGKVYLAEDAVLARSVAIKFIAGVDPDLDARQRFLMEARAAARIQHPNVVGVYRVGELGDRPYIVSELIRGTSLAELPRPMPWQKALDLAIELARGLAAAHRRGVVHCDIKPGNAMLTDDGVAKLVDFGLSRVVHEGTSETSASEGPMVGTPDYMAPEVWAGQQPSRRSDVYSFGAVLFELLSGAPPFAHVEARELSRIVREEPAPEVVAPDTVAPIDSRLVRLIARCLERDPELRYPSGEELREALEQLHPSRAVGSHSLDQNPYRGLRTFEATHRGLFFGRGLEISAIVERLRTDSVVIVTGDSGVGKSSLLRAGVVPAIIDGAIGAGRVWQSLTMLPGRRPLAALAAALGDPTIAGRVLADPEALPRELRKRAGDNGILLFVDQMEELVTVGDPDEVAALDAGLARISEGMPDIRLVTTVRADFLSRIAMLPRLGRELSRLLYFVSPLPPERIRDVITGPASATGVQFESESMIAELVEATAQAGSGGLPLLSFALAELWEARDRDRGVITQTALETMGGVAGALARHGDAVLAGMPAADRPHVRRVLLRLVTSVGTRVRRTEAELSVSEGTKVALDALVKGRLLVVHDGDDGATFELAHEILVRGWGTLRDWLDADAEERARRERVAAAAAEWHRAGRRNDATWRGPQLLEARTLDITNLTALERDFIRASIRAGIRRMWLRRAAIAGVVALLVVAVIVQRSVARGRLADEVGVELDAARALVAKARTADASGKALGAEALAKFDSGKPDAEKLWKQVLADRAESNIAYRSAAGHAEAALAKDPGRDDVKDLLGDIIYERMVLADREYATERRDELLARLDAYDGDGSRRARWALPGIAALHAASDTAIMLEPPGAPPKAITAGDHPLAPGSYVAVATAAGRAPMRVPFLVERGGRTDVELAIPTAVPAGFVSIPAGRFTYGNTDEDLRSNFMSTVPAHVRSTPAYLIARTEVTVADWLGYVAEQPAEARKALLPHITAASGFYVIEGEPGAWRFTLQPMELKYSARSNEPMRYPARAILTTQDWMRFPMGGITAKQALAYALWLDRTKRVPGARLCTEVEWERAARGVDTRSYPHGERPALADLNIDVTYTKPLMGPDEVGSHPASNSPYGLADMSGNVFEWTIGEFTDPFVLRGGSFYHDRKTANVTNRYSIYSDEMSEGTIGMRLCATPQ